MLERDFMVRYSFMQCEAINVLPDAKRQTTNVTAETLSCRCFSCHLHFFFSVAVLMFRVMSGINITPPRWLRIKMIAFSKQIQQYTIGLFASIKRE
jgi:hypothetical protein